MKTTGLFWALILGMLISESSLAGPEYIANFASFPAYPYNTSSYKQGSAFVGCGPTTGAMIFGYFQAAHSLTNLLTNPGTGVNTGINTAWALHAATYMNTDANGFGSVLNIKPGLEQYAASKGYTVKVLIHAATKYDASNTFYTPYGTYGDAWTNDAIYQELQADGSWKYNRSAFCDFIAPMLANGIPIFLTIDSDADGSGDHWVALVGYDKAAGTYAFYDTYDTSVHWADIYYCYDNSGKKVNSISLVRTVALSLPNPDIAVDPTSWDYGSVVTGGHKSKTFSVRNGGSANLNVTAVTLTGTNAAEFSLLYGGPSFTLAPGISRDIEVKFSPVSAGSKSASMRIESNDPNENPFTISLSGTGDAGAPDIASNKASHNFGSLTRGRTTETTFIISNVGGASLRLSAATLGGMNASEFSITSGGDRFLLAAGATRNLVVRFSPITSGSKSASLSIASNDPDENPFVLSLTGTGRIPFIAVNPSDWKFGLITLGTYSEKTFTIYNRVPPRAIGGELDVTAVTLSSRYLEDGWFSIRSGGGAFTIASGDSHKVIVRFTPTDTKNKRAVLNIASNDPDNNPLMVSLYGGAETDSPDILVDGKKDAFYSQLSEPSYGFLQLKSYAFNDNGIPTSDADLSAKIWAAWDDEWFYLYEEVLDDVVSGNAPDVWAEDCLELNFSQATDSVNNTVWQTRLTALGKAAAGVVVEDSMNNVPANKKQWVRKVIPGGYALELALKWSAISFGTETITPATGSVFGLAINQHDNDGNAWREATVQWAAVLSNNVYNTPKYLATATFLPDHRLRFIAKNHMTGVTNPVPYDGTSFYMRIDGKKDPFYHQLTSPGNGYLQLKSYAYNDNGRPTNDADLSAKIWTAWDNGWFYLYEEVRDDTLRGNSVSIWGEDELELKFDPQPTDSVINSVFDTRLTALGMGTPGVVAADSMNTIAAAQKKWIRTTTADGYILELAIQWPAIVSGSETISPAVNNIFGMAILQHDNDKGYRESSLEWAAVLSDWVFYIPKYHGTVKFLTDNKLQFIPTNNMTGVTNPVPYDGTTDYTRDGDKVKVTFRVTSPPGTPSADILYLAGSMNFWDPGPDQTGTDGSNHDQPMQKIGPNLWELTLACKSGENLEYKYTRGTWNKVEKGSLGEEFSNRIFLVPETAVIQLDAVRNWGDIPSAVDDNTRDTSPTAYQLQQNYPNPFNPSTTIRYALPHGTNVVLTVYNTQGKQIAILTQGYQEKGYHTINFDASNLADGVYFYRLKAGSFEEMKKLVLLH